MGQFKPLKGCSHSKANQPVGVGKPFHEHGPVFAHNLCGQTFFSTSCACLHTFIHAHR